MKVRLSALVYVQVCSKLFSDPAATPEPLNDTYSCFHSFIMNERVATTVNANMSSHTGRDKGIGFISVIWLLFSPSTPVTAKTNHFLIHNPT